MAVVFIGIQDIKLNVVFTLGVSATLTIHCICDLFEQSHSSKQLKGWNSCLNRCILILATALPDLTVFCASIVWSEGRFVSSLPAMISSISDFKLFASIAYVLSVLDLKEGAKVSNSCVTFVRKFMFVSSLTLFVVRTIAFASSTREIEALYLGLNIVKLFIFAQILPLCWYSFRSISMDFEDSQQLLNMWCVTALTLRIVCNIVIASSDWINGYGSSALGLQLARWDSYIHVGFVLVVLTIPWRLVAAKARRLLSKMLDEKDSFMQFISHEMRTPLNIIQLSIAFLESEVAGIASLLSGHRTAAITEALADIEGSCETAVSVLDDLVTVEKLRSQKLTLQPEPTSAKELLETVFRQFTSIAENHRLSFALEWGDGDGDSAAAALEGNMVSLADSHKLAQVLRNLLLNAFKFTPPNGSVTIRVRKKRKEGGTSRWFGSQSIRSTLLGGRLLNSWRGWRMRSVVPELETASDLTATPAGMQATRLQAAAVLPDQPVASFDGVLVIEVVDSGVGMTVATQAGLFSQYAQFNSAVRGGADKGSGLGLWLSKGQCRSVGGGDFFPC